MYCFETYDGASEKRRTVNDAETSISSAKRVTSAMLLRGDSCGQLTCWRLSTAELYHALPPPLPARQCDVDCTVGDVTLHSKSRVPLIGAIRFASLAAAWQRYKPAGIIDHLADCSTTSESCNPSRKRTVSAS